MIVKARYAIIKMKHKTVEMEYAEFMCFDFDANPGLVYLDFWGIGA